MNARRKLVNRPRLDGDIVYVMEMLRRTWGVETTVTLKTAYIREGGVPVCYVRVEIDEVGRTELQAMYKNVPYGEGEYVGLIASQGILHWQYVLLLRLYAQLFAMTPLD